MRGGGQTRFLSGKGFTLAEVLITLGVIGIVAAMTLPVITQKTQDKQTVSQLKKAYSALSQAYLMAVNENGTPENWGAGGMYEDESHKIMARNFTKYMKVIVDCIDMSNSDVAKYCSEKFANTKYYSTVRIADGATVSFRMWYGDCKSVYGTTKPLKNVCGRFTVDVNGNKKPNEYGQDMFSFYVTKQGIFPMGSENDTVVMFKKYCDRHKISEDTNYDHGMGCTAWVLMNENLDYKYCDDLNWGGKTKCK